MGHRGSLHLHPTGAGEGLSLVLEPAIGITAGRLEQLWSLAADGSGLGFSNTRPGARFAAELGYGFRLGSQVLLTPYSQVGITPDDSSIGMGLR